MEFGEDLKQIAFMFMVAAAVGGLALAIFFPYFSGSAGAAKRVKAISEGSKGVSRQSLRSRLMSEDPKDARRRQLQDSLKQIEETEKQRKKRLTLRVMLEQAGIDVPIRTFWMISAGAGLALAFGVMMTGVPWYACVAAGLIGALGLPRWVVNMLRKRRQNTFVNDFADAIDVMVRGLKAGLPITDAMKVIAAETPAPVGPEFVDVVEGQRVGITIDQGLERMFERMPLPEVNFLAIVMAIQSKTGGNLAEALNNLSRVLRDRKKMKAKIKAVSQEAKASAAIIGALPFCIMGAMMLLNPAYLNPLFEEKVGHLLLAGSGMWMGTGILIMRKMINFDI
jgi:tight adherence protein B